MGDVDRGIDVRKEGLQILTMECVRWNKVQLNMAFKWFTHGGVEGREKVIVALIELRARFEGKRGRVRASTEYNMKEVVTGLLMECKKRRARARMLEEMDKGGVDPAPAGLPIRARIARPLS
jgi:hypothetical protein